MGCSDVIGDGAGALFTLDLARRRRAVILANPELQERELAKLAALTRALAEALRGRGVSDAVADLAAEAGMAVFRVTFERWVTDPSGLPWSEQLGLATGALEALVATLAPGQAAARARDTLRASR